ncbi:PREDICTED: RNA-binding protein Raly-like [Lepidothrix coronata]|uniref:RNA-binding protein Raly-like n=1 Tax=Lepidothrix coronata TaxID=321398 RepID=A0A6J0J7I5_9PASS|nr:PREDICTED: RNA-binding protein Raly-like [Lepidothrix coronata]
MLGETGTIVCVQCPLPALPVGGAVGARPGAPPVGGRSGGARRSRGGRGWAGAGEGREGGGEGGGVWEEPEPQERREKEKGEAGAQRERGRKERPGGRSSPARIAQDFSFPNLGWMEEEAVRKRKMPQDTQTDEQECPVP